MSSKIKQFFDYSTSNSHLSGKLEFESESAGSNMAFNRILFATKLNQPASCWIRIQWKFWLVLYAVDVSLDYVVR